MLAASFKTLPRDRAELLKDSPGHSETPPNHSEISPDNLGNTQIAGKLPQLIWGIPRSLGNVSS